MRAWALLVVSSEAQAETIPHQRSWAAETAKEKGWTIDAAGVFEGVSSGRDGPRKLVEQMMDALRATPVRPEWLLMIRADRLGRGTISEQLPVRAELRALGVRIWTREKGELLLDSDEAELIAAFDAYVARKENSVRRDKLLGRYARKRAAGLPVAPRRPYGLALGPDKRDVAVPELADAIRLAFQMRIDGATFYAISKKMAEVAPPVQFKAHMKQLQWSPIQVKRTLQQRAYIGPVVDEVTFARAQRNMAIERRPRKFVWELGGAPLLCYCGGAMAGNIAHKKDRPEAGHRYYRCFSRAHGTGGGRLVRADLLERRFAEKLAEMGADSELIEQYREPAPVASQLLVKALPAATKKLEDLDRQKARIWDLHTAGKLRDDDLQPRLTELAALREAAQAQVRDLTTQQLLTTNSERISREAEVLIKSAAATYPTATPLQRMELVRIVTAHLGGGLCVEENDTLSFRVPRRLRARARQLG